MEQDKKMVRQLVAQNVSRGMPLQPNCRWHRVWRKQGYTHQQIIEEFGWEATEEKGDWQYWAVQIIRIGKSEWKQL